MRKRREAGVGVLFARVAGLDVHKKSITVCVRILLSDGQVRSEVRRFGTAMARYQETRGSVVARRHRTARAGRRRTRPRRGAAPRGGRFSDQLEIGESPVAPPAASRRASHRGSDAACECCGSSLRSAPHWGQSPRQSSRQSGFIGSAR